MRPDPLLASHPPHDREPRGAACPGAAPARGTPSTCTGPASPSARDAHQRISSHDLLAGQRLIHIDHEGDVYRLQLTRQGKLILTK